jgi:diacylglycerol kinase family enzyme
MIRRRRQRSKKPHFAILVNKKAENYNQGAVQKLTKAIKAAGGYYSVFEPATGMDMMHQAEVAVGKGKPTGELSLPFARGGKITALIACGGDGSFNLVARAALKADIPAGVLPMGRHNNIARHLYDSGDTSEIIKRLVSGTYQKIDFGRVADQYFFGSIGIGFVSHLAQELEGRSTPRFAIGWSQLGSRSAARVSLKKTVLKVDNFRFEISPIIININLLPYSAGLPLSPASIADDGMAEIILDQGNDPGDFSAYTRLIFKREYLYGNEVRLYRGRQITIQPLKGRTLYLDGELLKLPTDILEIKVENKKLSVIK